MTPVHHPLPVPRSPNASTFGEFRNHPALELAGIELSPRTCGRTLTLSRALYGLPTPARGERTGEVTPQQSSRRHVYVSRANSRRSGCAARHRRCRLSANRWHAIRSVASRIADTSSRSPKPNEWQRPVTPHSRHCGAGDLASGSPCCGPRHMRHICPDRRIPAGNCH